MRLLLPLLALAFASCVSDRHSVVDLITPDRLHANYGEGNYGDTFASGGSHAPWRRFGHSDGDFDSWSLGLSWNLTGPPRNRELEQIARQMQIATRLLADRAQTPPVIVQSAPSVPTVVVEAPVRPSASPTGRTSTSRSREAIRSPPWTRPPPPSGRRSHLPIALNLRAATLARPNRKASRCWVSLPKFGRSSSWRSRSSPRPSRPIWAATRSRASRS